MYSFSFSFPFVLDRNSIRSKISFPVRSDLKMKPDCIVKDNTQSVLTMKTSINPKKVDNMYIYFVYLRFICHANL